MSRELIATTRYIPARVIHGEGECISYEVLDTHRHAYTNPDEPYVMARLSDEEDAKLVCEALNEKHNSSL